MLFCGGGVMDIKDRMLESQSKKITELEKDKKKLIKLLINEVKQSYYDTDSYSMQSARAI